VPGEFVLMTAEGRGPVLHATAASAWCSMAGGALAQKLKAGLAHKDQPGENTKIGLRFNHSTLLVHF
jgi:hypothetical protein